MKTRHVALGLAVLALAASSAPGQQGPAAPRLLVVLVVDQMRADYVSRYGRHWNGGLKRLLEKGAVFARAGYPYMNTVTCAGHATIGTGALPATHGITSNSWWDRAAGRIVTCTEDPRAEPISYGVPAKGGDSAFRLRVPTLAEELRGQLGPASRAVTFALKPRSAIMLAGHRVHAATWFDAATGSWITSSAFTEAPLPFIAALLRTRPIQADLDKVWTRRLPESAYLFADDVPGEKPPSGWSAAFPHPLRVQPDTSVASARRLWPYTPYADAYLGKLAAAAVEGMKLGQGTSTDMLGVSFSVLDSVGHNFGPQSHEVQDVLAALDETIGELLAHLDRTVGAANYVVALSADHGVSPIPEHMALLGLPAGRIVTDEVASRLEKALAPLLGSGPLIARMAYNEVYFAPGVYDRIRGNPEAMQAAMDVLLETPGVWRVYRGEELASLCRSADEVARAAALSYVPGVSGDLVVVPRPYYFFVAAASDTPPGPAATHGSAHAYDQRVPLVLMGSGIRADTYLETATPADIAPTLAFLSGITLAHADGRVLTEALAR